MKQNPCYGVDAWNGQERALQPPLDALLQLIGQRAVAHPV